jgi:hypothetical protein
LLLLVWSGACLGQTTILWREGFEANEDYWSRWSVDGGVWNIGVPTSGPGQAFAGAQCAATVLDGNYPPNTDARLIRDESFIVPAAAQLPRLRFWHWFDGGTGAVATVEVMVVGTGTWQPLSPTPGWITNQWTRPLFDLSPFSGQRIQIGFHFQSDAGADVAPGWYIDEVMVETGSDVSSLVNTPEGFESGLDGWAVDHGIWTVGTPSIGAIQAYAGTNCAGTVLSRLYPPNADSRLISPEFVVPAATDNPRLRFWHWFGIYPGDFGQVEISLAGGGWQPLSPKFAYNSVVWTRPSYDLSAFANQTAQIAFHFKSDADANVAFGWFIDEVVVETGPTDWDPVAHPESFESGLGNWTVDNGTWETGIPTFGPAHAADGINCAGTVLSGRYGGNTDSRLISPPFTVPPVSQVPRLRFWQWLRSQSGDPSTVEVRVVGQDWQALSPAMVARDGTWARPYFALDAFAGQRVQLAFHFQSNGDTDVDAGWYVDGVTVETGPLKLNFINGTEDFETGLGDWSVDYGSWNLGTPVSYPYVAHSGTNCVGTSPTGLYVPGVDSRLISPPFVVPQDNARLRFWHWFSIFPGDFGQVDISVNGADWQAISPQYTANGVVWSEPSLDLRSYAGQNVRVAFHFHSDADLNVAAGWFVDDVSVATGPSDWQGVDTAEGFESGLGDWSVDNGTWEVGHPYSGPGFAFKGTNSAGTNIRFGGNTYIPNTDSRLISPEFTVPCATADPRLRFAQWYDIAAGDAGTVEIKVAGSDWQSILGPISGSNPQWSIASYDLSSFAGQRVQMAFHFQSNADAQVGAGWFVDEVKVQADLLAPQPDGTVAQGSVFTSVFGSPCQNLRFSLGPGAPSGATIDPALGILAWFPSGNQGPGVYPIQVCVADVSQPTVPIQCVSFNVTVVQVNQPPTIDSIPPQVIAAGVPLDFTVTASDLDVPKQTLTFSLDQGAPFGATIDPAGGMFSWTPTDTQATAQYSITVRVTDNGNPPLSATTTFTAAPSGGVTAATLQVQQASSGQITICLNGPSGIYTLESAGDLNASTNSNGWTTLQQLWKVDNQTTCLTTTISSNPHQFFRIRRGL